jgi:hypothetical protein
MNPSMPSKGTKRQKAKLERRKENPKGQAEVK